MTVPLVAMLAYDRKNLKTYILMGIFAVICGAALENFTTWLGFWTHLSYPRVGLASAWNVGLYFHYVTFSWFIGNSLKRRFR